MVIKKSDKTDESTKNSETEIKQLVERCKDLEKSWQLMKLEYENCEDYWASKLDEERQIFEQ